LSISEAMSGDSSLMARPYIVERMREEDLREVVEIEEMTGLNRWGYDAYRRELLKNPNAVMLVARSLRPGRSVIGFFAGWTIENELHINNIASHPDYRRMGVGRALMEEGIDVSIQRSVAFVLLEVRASNHAAQELYRKLGFHFINRRRDYYRAPTEDAFVMKLELC
jgi:[ribosomal protein S18]-alanine N-acetyltransferase